MKKFLTGLCLAAAAAMALTTPAQALCVSERDIVNTTPSNDGKLLTLKMRDGRVLVNHLQGVCSDLQASTALSGFCMAPMISAKTSRAIRVLQSGQTCLLGRFEQGKTPAPAPKAP